MDTPEPNWDDLEKLALSWLHDGCARVEDAMGKLRGDDKDLGFLAAQALQSAAEYLAAAFESFKSRRFSAGLCCCRPVFETAITVMWCAHGKGNKLARIQRWIKTTAAKRMRLGKDLQNMATRPGADEEDLVPAMSVCKKELEKLVGVKKLPNLKQMLTQIDPGPAGGRNLEELYTALYTFPCRFAHAPLEPERYFPDEGNFIAWLTEPEMPPVAPWIVMTIAYCAVFTPFMLFGWDFSNIKRDYVSALQ